MNSGSEFDLQVDNKVFGIGMSKTGTTTLQACFRALKILPNIGHNRYLKEVALTDKVNPLLKTAECYRSFNDSPWYTHYQELDKRFPGSKFILTLRKDAQTRADSSYRHRLRKGNPPKSKYSDYIERNIARYNKHNDAVLEYFKKRKKDLLVVCWERGDGWAEICEFLHIDTIPDEPFPHLNIGSEKEKLAFGEGYSREHKEKI